MTLDDLRGRLTCTLPEAGRILGIGRDAAYAAGARGDIPTLRLGRRIVVPVPRLLELLGAGSSVTTTRNSESPAATAEPIATDSDPHGATHDDRHQPESHSRPVLRSA